MKRVPKFIADQYGGAHNFRSHKRAILRGIRNELEELRLGCAYFPCGSGPVELIDEQIKKLQTSLSVRNWGK